MDRRLDLHALLCDVLGNRHCYYQPPETIKMEYPCIIYSWSGDTVRYANNGRYLAKKKYTVTVVDYNPDSELPNALAKLPLCSFDRHYTADNLHHFVYTLYY